MRQALSSPASFIRYSRLREWSRWHGSFFHIIFFCSVFFLFLLFFLFGWTIGIFATAFILRFGPAVEILVWSSPALIMPFAAVFYPVEALPGAFRPISYLIPISYVFEGMRRAAIGGTFDVRFFI